LRFFLAWKYALFTRGHYISDNQKKAVPHNLLLT
jgi:hypothetical protein